MIELIIEVGATGNMLVFITSSSTRTSYVIIPDMTP